MNAYFLHALLTSVAVLLLSVLCAVLLHRKRKSRERHYTLLCLGLGSLLAFVTMSYPVQRLQGYGIANSIVQAVHHTMQAVTFGTSTEVFANVFKAMSGQAAYTLNGMEQLFTLYAIFLQLAMPLLIAIGLIASMRFLRERAAYRLSFFKRNVYVFSEMNLRSVCLGESLRAHEHRATIVYTGLRPEHLGDDSQDGYALFARVKRMRALYMREDIADVPALKPGRKHSLYIFYIADHSEHICEHMLRGMESQFTRKAPKYPAEVYLFSMEAEAEHVVDYASSQYPGVRFRLVNEIRLMMYELFSQNPLHAGLADNEEISVLIVGGGKVGMEAVKTVVWLGQSLSHPLRVNVLERDADSLRAELAQQCPELFKDGFEQYGIKFRKADVNKELDAALDACGNVTYAIVSLGDDNDMNISTALSMRAFFARKYPERGTDAPAIHIVMNDEMKHNMVNDLTFGNSGSNLHIKAFGAIPTLYAYGKAFHSSYEQNALLMHFVTRGILWSVKNVLLGTKDAPCKDTSKCLAFIASVSAGKIPGEKDMNAEQRKAVQKVIDGIAAFEKSDYNRQSSIAAYLHIDMKVHDVDCHFVRSGNQLSEAQLYAQYIEFVKKHAASAREADNPVYRLAECEHMRWNAYLRAGGFRRATVMGEDGHMSDVERYYALTGDPKNFVSKLHPCLVGFDELPGMSERLSDIIYAHACKKNNAAKRNKPVDYQQYDIDMIAQIPEILEMTLDEIMRRYAMYRPNPIDTSGITLEKDILDLGEKLARNTHEVWAKGRAREGWTYGLHRNDETKQTPCMVEYDDLPESEKEYDRRTALETLRLIQKLGYSIVKKG